MRVLLLNAAHSVLQNQCLSMENRTVLLLGRHNQLRCGPTLTINDTMSAPPVMLQGPTVETLSHCLQEVDSIDNVVGCAFSCSDDKDVHGHLQQVSDKSKEFLFALRRYFAAKGAADVEKAMLDKVGKMVFVSMCSSVVRAELKSAHTCCLKSSMLCHRLVYNENLLGPEEKDDKNCDDVQFIGTSASAVKRVRRSARSDSEFSHIKSQDVDLRIWSGEGSLVHEFDVNFPAFNMPTYDDSSGGSLHTLIALLHHSNAELHRDIVTELHNCHKLASQYAVEYDQRFAMPRAACRKAGGDADAVLFPS
jgi:hypothetical protein